MNWKSLMQLSARAAGVEILKEILVADNSTIIPPAPFACSLVLVGSRTFPYSLRNSLPNDPREVP